MHTLFKGAASGLRSPGGENNGRSDEGGRHHGLDGRIIWPRQRGSDVGPDDFARNRRTRSNERPVSCRVRPSTGWSSGASRRDYGSLSDHIDERVQVPPRMRLRFVRRGRVARTMDSWPTDIHGFRGRGRRGTQWYVRLQFIV